MGVNYKQLCIFGFCVDDCKRITSPKVTEKQPRYDPYTGKQTHTETILVKHAELKYVFEDIECDCFEDLENAIEEKFGFNCVCDYEDEMVFIGFKIGYNDDCGRVDLLDGGCSFDRLQEMDRDLKVVFPSKETYVYFINYVG